MGSTDSTCCGSQSMIKQSPPDSIEKLKQYRKLQQIRKLKSDQIFDTTTTSQPDFSPIPNDKIDSVLTSYIESIQLKSEVQKQYQLLTRNETNNPKIKRKYSKTNKPKYNHIGTQIEILHSEGAKAQSLLLCIKTEKIGVDLKRGTIKTFRFLPFLKTNMNDEAVKELFNKFLNSKLNISPFVSLLTIIVIAYKIKLHQLKKKPLAFSDIDAVKINAAIEHLAIWCIRRYGNKQNTKRRVIVLDDVGNEIKGNYNLYKFNFAEKDCSRNLYEWTQEYVNTDGYIS
eukprot:1011399_1